jgi:hypothetical protein
MEKLNVVSKKLGVSKGKIKDMCKSGEINFEIVNGIYYVDVDEVKQKLENNKKTSIKYSITTKTKISNTEIIDDNSLLVWNVVDNSTYKQPQNRSDYKTHTKSPHIVKKHYRNQPYGSRDNPQYRRIEIKSFVKGGKKVG